MTLKPAPPPLIPPVPTQMGGMSQPPLPPPPPAAPSLPAEDEPAAKRFKTEEQLVPEAEFLAQFGSEPVTFSIQVPIVSEKPEWNLNGQLLKLTMPLTEQVSSIKNKLMDILTMPVSKQKLQLDVRLRDSLYALFFFTHPESFKS